MKKLVLLIGIMVLIAININAQFGVKAGLNFSNLTFDEIKTDDYNISMVQDKKAGMHVGLMGRLEIFSLYFQPELLFNTSSNTFELENISSGETEILKQNFNKLSIPFIVGKKIKFFRAGLGPVATILISDKSELADYTSYEEKFNTATFGYQLNVGLDIASLTLDFKYEGNLSKFGDGIEVGGQVRSFDSRESQMIVSVGYFF